MVYNCMYFLRWFFRALRFPPQTVYLKIGTMHYLLNMEDFRKTGEDTHELGDYADLHVINHSNRINCYKEKIKFSAD
jgi:hypothetical protein